jgi:hypothetical protein
MIEHLLDLCVETLRSFCYDDGERALFDAVIFSMNDEQLLDVLTERTIESLRGRVPLTLN